MKTILMNVALFLVTCLSAFAQSSECKSSLNIMSFNIRMDTPADGENQWSNRKDFASNLVKFYDVDVCGAQEVLHHQLVDMLDRLPEYAYVGVGREDGKTKGEYAPILYNKNRLSLIKHGDFWLAEDLCTPGVKGWDAACERVATWAIFKDKCTAKTFFFLNTHLDHMGKKARHEGAALVLSQANALSEGLPIIVTGDFNATPEDDSIQVLMNATDPNALKHTRSLTTLKYGPDWTFHDFGRVSLEKRNLIDYIFIKGNFKVLKDAVITDTHDQLYPSDHCPIMCTLIIE